MGPGLAVVVLALVCAGVRAQNTTAKCLGEFSWSFNNLGQSPCLVAAYLLLPCTPGGGRVGALPAPGRSYITPVSGGPLDTNACTCSTVTYNAIQACALCQEGESVTWSDWSAGCTDEQTSIGQYPEAVDSATRLPQWLFQDVVESNRFDVSKAEQVAASSLPDNGAGIPTTATSTPTPPASRLPSPNPPKPVPLFAIIAGTIGGIATLLIVAIIVTCIIRRKKRLQGDEGEKGMRQHSRGKSIEDLVISKPVVPPSPAPNTGSSFGPPGPAPWPTASSGGRAASGWPQGPATPRGAVPLPVTVTVQRPDSERRVRIKPGQSCASSPTVTVARSDVGSVGHQASQTSPVSRTTSPRPVAGPIPQAPYDPEDPRTWAPSAPPPRKLQIKMQGLPATPRQQRAVRVNSRDDGRARYPTPQLGERPELETQPQIGVAVRGVRPTVSTPARHSPSSSQAALVSPSSARTPASRMGHSPSLSDSRAAPHSPASSRSGLGVVATALHARSQSSSHIMLGQSPTGPALTSQSSNQSLSLYAQSYGSSSQSGVPAASSSSRRDIPWHSPSSSQGHSRYAHSPSPSQSGPARQAHSPTSSTSSGSAMRYKSPSELLALERSGSTSTVGRPPMQEMYEGPQ